MSSSFAFGTLQGVHVAAVSLGRRALVQQTLPPSTTLKNAAAALLESMDLAGAEDSFVKFVLCTALHTRCGDGPPFAQFEHRHQRLEEAWMST